MKSARVKTATRSSYLLSYTWFHGSIPPTTKKLCMFLHTPPFPTNSSDFQLNCQHWKSYVPCFACLAAANCCCSHAGVSALNDHDCQQLFSKIEAWNAAAIDTPFSGSDFRIRRVGSQWEAARRRWGCLVPGHQEEAFLEVRVYQFVKIFVARFRFRINHLGGRAHAISLHWLPSNLHRGRVVSYNDYNRRKEPAILQLSTVEELMAK